MSIIKITDQDGFEIEMFENADAINACNGRTLSSVKGVGRAFKIPDGVTGINGYSEPFWPAWGNVTYFSLPNIKKIYIPASVKTIGIGAFDRFDSSLHIYCEASEKPEGFEEGAYCEYFEEDYEFYPGDAYYGTWLTGGTLHGLSKEEIKEGENLPIVHWGITPEKWAQEISTMDDLVLMEE